uniref:Uncharacterized protein n=1 Tax=Rhizophora mucronata TaxID=61149 RepID=A0A2P2MXP9_RHIMU
MIGWLSLIKKSNTPWEISMSVAMQQGSIRPCFRFNQN